MDLLEAVAMAIGPVMTIDFKSLPMTCSLIPTFEPNWSGIMLEPITIQANNGKMNITISAKWIATIDFVVKKIISSDCVWHLRFKH